MITIPLWLFVGLCLFTGSSALLWIGAVVRAERMVDRILAEELSRPSAPEGHLCGDSECDLPALDCHLLWKRWHQADRLERGQQS